MGGNREIVKMNDEAAIKELQEQVEKLKTKISKLEKKIQSSEDNSIIQRIKSKLTKDEIEFLGLC